MDIAGIVQGGVQALGAIGNRIGSDKRKEEQALAEAAALKEQDNVNDSNAIRAAASLAQQYDKNGSSVHVGYFNTPTPVIESKPTVDPTALTASIANVGALAAQIVSGMPRNNQKVVNSLGSNKKNDPIGATSSDTATNTGGANSGVLGRQGTKLIRRFNIQERKN